MSQNCVASIQYKICRKENQNFVSYLGNQILSKVNDVIDICGEVWDKGQVLHVRQEEPDFSLSFPSLTGSLQSEIGPLEHTNSANNRRNSNVMWQIQTAGHCT
jgi:hypothetical protein